MKHFVNISFSSLETKSTLPSRYDMHVTHNKPTQVDTHACANDQHSQVENIHVKQRNRPTQVNYSCMFKHNETIKIPLFRHTNSHACIQFFNSLTSTIISTKPHSYVHVLKAEMNKFCCNKVSQRTPISISFLA